MAGGRCLCGSVGFDVEGDPKWVAYCHCASCRRHTGAPVTVFVNYRRERVRFTAEPAKFESSPGVTRSHCAACGTSIAYETAKRPGEIDLYVNAFDDPAAFTPGVHVFFAEHVPWLDIRDDLPRKD